MPERPRLALTPGLVGVAVFTLAYVLAAVVGLVATGNREFLFYFVVLLVLIVLMAIVHWNVGLSTWSLALMSVWGLLHMAGGLVKYDGQDVLYNLWLIPERLKYDQIVHAFGFGATTWICWQALKRHLADPLPRFGPLFLCAVAGLGFGATNEVIEFVATRFIPDTNVGDYVNTGWDLVANTVGVTIAAILIAIFDRPASG